MNTLSSSFNIPAHLNAKVPAEYVGLSREQVRLMVLHEENPAPCHTRFECIDEWLEAGDVLVLNNSRTIPPVLQGTLKDKPVEIRLSRKLSEDNWEALVLGNLNHTSGPIQLPEGLQAEIKGYGSVDSLFTLSFSESGSNLLDFLYRYGQPVYYEYIEDPLPLDMYQTVYGSAPGSVEMTSAGRAFTWNLLNKLKAKGIGIAYIQLHAGLSYYEENRWPNPLNHPEEFHVPEKTVELIKEARFHKRRVIAVGTTVVRALESAADQKGLRAKTGTTRLYVDGNHKLSTVDGLLTGFHEPEASHLDMLTAFIPESLLMNAYREAIQKEYLWHEFGDMNLILPKQLSSYY